jgi:hypothetical protein
VVLHKVTGAAELSSSARGQHRRKQKSGESAPPNEARPFTATDVIAAGTLSRALDKLVFSHPEVRLLCRMAISVSDVRQISFEEDAGLVVLVLGYDEPLLPLRYFTYLVEQPDEPPPAGSTEDEAIWAEYFRRELPPELQAYYHAVQHRADTLIEMLQQQQVVARGHTADGTPGANRS